MVSWAMATASAGRRATPRRITSPMDNCAGMPAGVVRDSRQIQREDVPQKGRSAPPSRCRLLLKSCPVLLIFGDHAVEAQHEVQIGPVKLRLHRLRDCVAALFLLN